MGGEGLTAYATRLPRQVILGNYLIDYNLYQHAEFPMSPCEWCLVVAHFVIFFV